MRGGDILLDLVCACEASGFDMPAIDFDKGCRLVASRLTPEMDEGIEEHFCLLLAHGDRLAAVLLLLPPKWGYSLHRWPAGNCVASIRSPFRQTEVTVESDDECTALLGALAASVKVAAVVA